MTDRLSGDGKVFRGKEFLADVHYEMQIPTPSTRSPMVEVQLRITPASIISGYFGPDCLTLHLNDGHKQNFFVITSHGDCKATGGPY